ncbi:thaumatin-like protein 1 [Coffea eugenioides]|uniref:thaumatin-like protein 1 n=1 Tax=Coffea eugenioides TaxID=49369 RepID=UPI000F6082EF|nr:thaumatin-like protein 1 [Coffea eugenioides]
MNGHDSSAMLIIHRPGNKIRSNHPEIYLQSEVSKPSAAYIFFIAGVQSAQFTFTNNCPYTIWPATVSGGGVAQLPTTGFELPSKSSVSIEVPAQWSGRIWARSFCSNDSSGKFFCKTADCGSGEVSCNGAGAIPPASLAEFTLAANNGMDFYDVSLVDGFNLPLSITPQSGSGSNCRSTSCPVDLNAICPQELAIRDDSGGAIIGCKSACLAFNQPQFCCTGEFGSPLTCPPTIFSSYFKNQCPQAYSYAYDDLTSTFTCTGGPDYLITFCS